ncbi:16S rRNA (cytosine(967)-C(5))-methyltransferase [hydrothermal vent metagenome]|uniref:16S rRNA (Cytosine(967)-C(5))-methyltransferase n=1 Tax=hydrothermal vent metagenome TaxID=652676 RepID=A0A3B0THP4_9ZZZZ
MKKTANIASSDESKRINDRGNGQHVAGLDVRMAAARALNEVLKGAAFEPMGEKLFKDGRDRALANRLTTTALRRHGHLNEIIASLLKHGVPARSGLFEAILRLGLTQLLFMADQAAHAALYLSVEAVRRDKRAARFAGLLNAVLRKAQREAQTWQSLDNSLLFPVWLQKKWRAQYGDDVLERFGRALLAGAPLDLTLADNDPELVMALGAKKILFDSVRISHRDKPVVQLDFYDEGRWWVQDVAATIPARLLELETGSMVLDMCAAPGGKTAQLFKAGYKVTALDNNPARLARLEENLKRLNFKAQLVEGQAEDFCGDEKFDGVLIDAPCSASGTFRRHPEVIWNRKQKDVLSRLDLQRALIRAAADNLKPGGVVVFCTCSLQAEEGEDQARWIEKNLKTLKADPISAAELDGLTGAISNNGWVRTHPGLDVMDKERENDCLGTLDGFFIARFRRV